MHRIRNRKYELMQTAVAPAWGNPMTVDFPATNSIVWNKGVEEIEWSYDGDRVEGALDPEEGLAQDQMADGIRNIYVRSVSGGQDVKVWLWQRGAIG